MPPWFSYAEKLESKDPKFLSKRDMQSLMDSSFWDMGSDGYRLHFINVFDRYHNYLGRADAAAVFHAAFQPGTQLQSLPHGLSPR